MIRPHPLTAMTEREWSQAWRGEQREIDRLNAHRGSWLPNVIERRGWGVVRWTSGRPNHAASSGQAVAETFVVLRPDVTTSRISDEISTALRDDPPMARVLGIGIRRHQLTGAGTLAAVGAVVLGALAVLVSLPALLVVLLVVVGLVAGAVGGAALAQYRDERQRAAVLAESRQARLVTGRYAPASWQRLVESATVLEATLPTRRDEVGEADLQAADAMRVALWEAAGLLLTSSDHTGVEILADGVSRLAQAHRA